MTTWYNINIYPFPTIIHKESIDLLCQVKVGLSLPCFMVIRWNNKEKSIFCVKEGKGFNKPLPKEIEILRWSYIDNY